MRSDSPANGIMKTSLVFAFNILIGAFLVFFIQPTSAKFILPAYGGSAYVWIACILFFQLSLFIGYLYAYLINRLLSAKYQAIIHILLIGVSLIYLPIAIDAPNRHIPSPAFQILGSLIDSMLLPLVLVSATSPLMQHWYAQTTGSKFPYKFYAISNAGSLLGLLGFPFLLELWLNVPAQFNLWSLLYVVFVLLSLAVCGLCLMRSQSAPSTVLSSLAATSLVKWAGLSAISSALLVAGTFYITQNLINMPLLWVIPLALYLISFIITFSDPKQIKLSFWHQNFVIWGLLFAWLLASNNLNGFDVIIVLIMLMFSGMMVTHSTLYRLRPVPEHLTLFYVMVALGGVFGSLFVNIITLANINHWWDLYLPLLAIAGLSLTFALRLYRPSPSIWHGMQLAASAFVIPAMVVAILLHINISQGDEIYRHRNFYGIISVIDKAPDQASHFRQLKHGSIVHGFQFLHPDMKQMPTAYYSHQSGVGGAFSFLHQYGAIKVGAIGLGTGTIAALAKPGDSIDFYEIDQDIIYASQSYFSFLSDSQAAIQIIHDDGRLGLGSSQTSKYDLLVIDAFSGDTIPFHLITEEAFELYQSMLKPNGIIAFHISNIYLNLAHVTHTLADKHWFNHEFVISAGDAKAGAFAADWCLLSQNTQLRPWLENNHYTLAPNAKLKEVVWTDASNSLLSVVRLKTN